MSYNVLIDDKRTLEEVKVMMGDDKFYNDEFIVVRNVDKLMSLILYDKEEFPSKISFDHDLSLDVFLFYGKYMRDNGMSAAKLICAIHMDMDQETPFIEYRVHSMNPVGKNNIISYLESYKRSL